MSVPASPYTLIQIFISSVSCNLLYFQEGDIMRRVFINIVIKHMICILKSKFQLYLPVFYSYPRIFCSHDLAGCKWAKISCLTPLSPECNRYKRLLVMEDLTITLYQRIINSFSFLVEIEQKMYIIKTRIWFCYCFFIF